MAGLPPSLAAMMALQARPAAGAASMAGLDVPENVTGAFAPFARTGTPSRADLLGDPSQGAEGSQDVMDQMTTSMGGGPQIEALQRLAEFKQREAADAQAASDTDLFNGGAERRAVAGAGVANKVGDLMSEGAYGRETLPYAEEDRQHKQADAQTHALLQYVQPAEIAAAGSQQAASTRAQGQVDAETAKGAGGPQRAMLNALIEKMKLSGKVPTMEERSQMLAAFGLPPDPATPAAMPMHR